MGFNLYVCCNAETSELRLYLGALLHEEIGEMCSDTTQHVQRRYVPLPLPRPPRTQIVEDKRASEVIRPQTTEDKWTSLRAYKKSKEFCFICGVKWSGDH